MSGAARLAVAYIRLAEQAPVTVEERARGSSRTAARDADSGSQRAAITTWAEREHVELRSWEVDVGVDSGTPIAERPGLLAAYRSIRAHRAGILVAARADRFARDAYVASLIESAALSEGATLRTADGSLSEKAGDRPTWTRSALDLARAHDSVVLRRRLRDAMADVLAGKRARGERIGTVPYGFRLAADGRHVEPDEAEQGVIATVRELSTSGASQRAIVARLALLGVTGRTGAPLQQTQVAKLLRSRA